MTRRSIVLCFGALALWQWLAVQAAAPSLVDLMASVPELSLFYESIIFFPETLDVLSDATQQSTVFAVSNEVIQAAQEAAVMFESDDWTAHLLAVLRHHVVPNQTLTADALWALDSVTTMLPEEQVLPIAQQMIIGGASITTPDLSASNGVLHIIDQILWPAFSKTTFANSLEAHEEFVTPTDSTFTSLVDIIDFVGGRPVLDKYQANSRGSTFLGCDLKALLTLETYLPQTINGAATVLSGEFLNNTFTDQTRRNFVEYNVLKQNFYYNNMQEGFVAISYPAAGCGHMFVSRKNGRVCFNNACVVMDDTNTNTPRQYLTSNGVGYVTDKCLVCPGIAMLVGYAADYAGLGGKLTSDLLQATGWNLRDLSLSVGSGGRMTLFASLASDWGDILPPEDFARLTTDPQWKLHFLDILKSMLVQGMYDGPALVRLVTEDGGPIQLTTLNGDILEIGFDPGQNRVTVNGLELFVANLRAVDGVMHLSEHIPQPKSLTMSLFELAKNMVPVVGAHFSLIEKAPPLQWTLDLTSADAPQTALFVVNEIWPGLEIKRENLTEALAENHIFDDMYSCERLTSLVGGTIDSINGIAWSISVNSAGFPCFTSTTQPGDALTACVAECDILAKNGILHKMELPLADPGVIVVKAPTGAPTVADNPDAPSSSPTVAVSDVDLEGCFQDLEGADMDGDGAVRRPEFYHFIAASSERKCFSEVPDLLTPEQILLFFRLACVCMDQEGSEENCCVGSDALLDLTGSVVADQTAYKTAICESMERNLGPGECAEGPGTDTGDDGQNGPGSGAGGDGDGSKGDSSAPTKTGLTFSLGVVCWALHLLA